MKVDFLEVLKKIDFWFESMRTAIGYGGPVVHWWDDCLFFTGVGLDWRYEGIIIGYLNLWMATGEEKWLLKAKRAGNDLAKGQLPSGNYLNACFELNPNTAGTPHEAAADLGLLNLACALKDIGDPDWRGYFTTAEKNLVRFYFEKLWNEQDHCFYDAPGVPSFVANKSATLVQALSLFGQASGKHEIIEKYIISSLNKILSFQVQEGSLAGGIYQNSLYGKRIASCFPYYIARCIPGLVLGYQQLGDQKFLEAALAAGQFILNHRYSDGSFPQVVYPAGRVNKYPQWVAPVGDILIALDLLRPYGFEYNSNPSLSWMMSGQYSDGSFQTAVGFGKARFPARKYDPRDEIACVGWVDKAFRYLSSRLLSC